MELSTDARRASQCPDQSAVADRQQSQRHEDAQHTVQPDVGAHQTPVERLQRARTLYEDRLRRLRARDGLDSVLEEARNVEEETDDEDGDDGGARAAQVDQRLDVERIRDGQVAPDSHRDRQPARVR